MEKYPTIVTIPLKKGKENQRIPFSYVTVLSKGEKIKHILNERNSIRKKNGVRTSIENMTIDNHKI